MGTIPLTSYGSQNGNSYLPPRFTVVGNHAVFAAAPPNSPLAVLSTDGTVGGTVNLSSAPVPVGSPSIPLASLGAAGSFAYYGSPMTGVIFRTDGNTRRHARNLNAREHLGRRQSCGRPERGVLQTRGKHSTGRHGGVLGRAI